MSKLKIIPKSVRHTFSVEEKQELSTELLNGLDHYSDTENEFDAIKSSFKAKLAEAESRVNTIRSQLRAGFEMRVTDCVVVYRPEDKEKDFFVAQDYREHYEEDGTPKGTVILAPIATEKMTDDDFQDELLRAEAVFENYDAIELFKPIGEDRGALVVGSYGKCWYSALRIKVGKHELSERLDTEQKAFKKREDAVITASKRALKWLKETCGDSWKGFEAAVNAAVKGN